MAKMAVQGPWSMAASSSAPPPTFRLACYILLTLCFCATLCLHFVGSIVMGIWALVLWIQVGTKDFADRAKALVSTYRKSWLALYKFDSYIMCWYDPRLVDELYVPRDEGQVDGIWRHLGYIYLWRGLVGTCVAAVPTMFWAVSVYYFVGFFNSPPTATFDGHPVNSPIITVTPHWAYLLHGCAYITLGIVFANGIVPWCLHWCIHCNMLLFPSINYNLNFSEGAPLLEPSKAPLVSTQTSSGRSTRKRSFADTVNSLVTSVAVATELKRAHEYTLSREVTLQSLALVEELVGAYQEATATAWPCAVGVWIEAKVNAMAVDVARLGDAQLTHQLKRLDAKVKRLSGDRSDSSLASPPVVAVFHGAQPGTNLVDVTYDNAATPHQQAPVSPSPAAPLLQPMDGRPPPSASAREDREDDLDSQNVMHDIPNRHMRPTQLTQLDAATGADYHVMSPTAAAYGQLSPRAASAEPSNGVFRSIFAMDQHHTIAGEDADVDSVHFQAYAPPMVAVSTTFEFALWAFLVHQRDDVRELAVSSALSREVLLPVRRGALAHVTLEVPHGFVLLDEPTKALDWQGDITNVQYQVRCASSATVGQAMFKATIAVGAKVMVLKAYLFVSTGQSYADKGDEDVVALSCELERLEESYHEIAFDDLELHGGQVVGSGHYGDAVRATYRGQEVVVKTLRPDVFGENTDQIVDEFRHEAAVLNMFGHHPNIVPFVGASTDVSRPLALVTEYLPYGSVADTFSSAVQLSVAEKETILYDAAAGLLNVHEGGFVHRDVAARNVLIDPRGRGKLCDFGLCRRVDASMGGSHFQHGHFPLRYMAPESLQPPHAFSFKSDAYMFGVLMWETFAEQTPFASLAPRDAAALVLEGHRLDKNASVIPPKYQSLMDGCFAEDPARRLSMVELVHALGRLNVV